jgi:hypothetical protein
MAAARAKWVCLVARWLKFNAVGGIGIGVQLAALAILKSVLHVDYLAATASAVEAAILHNFFWHERFTWADRARLVGRAPAEIQSDHGSIFTHRELASDEGPDREPACPIYGCQLPGDCFLFAAQFCHQRPVCVSAWVIGH